MSSSSSTPPSRDAAAAAADSALGLVPSPDSASSSPPYASPSAPTVALSPPPPALLTFLRGLSASHLYPTLIHLGVRAVGDLCTLKPGALEAEGVGPIKAATLRDAARGWAPPPAAPEWDEHVTLSGYLYYVHVRVGGRRAVLEE